MEIHRVSAYHEVEHALITDLKQSLYDEGKILMDKVLVTLHGDEHRQVARSKASCSARTFLGSMRMRWPQFAQRNTGPILTEASLDLKELGYRIMVHLSLSFAGIDRITGPSRRRTPAPLLIQLGQAPSASCGRREPIFQEIREAIDEFKILSALSRSALALLEQYRRHPERRDLPRHSHHPTDA